MTENKGGGESTMTGGKGRLLTKDLTNWQQQIPGNTRIRSLKC